MSHAPATGVNTCLKTHCLLGPAREVRSVILKLEGQEGTRDYQSPARRPWAGGGHWAGPSALATCRRLGVEELERQEPWGPIQGRTSPGSAPGGNMEEDPSRCSRERKRATLTQPTSWSSIPGLTPEPGHWGGTPDSSSPRPRRGAGEHLAPALQPLCPRGDREAPADARPGYRLPKTEAWSQGRRPSTLLGVSTRGACPQNHV